MKLGKLKLINNLFLAPLQNITTPPYRRFCRHFSDIGLVFIPMIYTKRINRNIGSIKEELIKIEEEKPIFIQLMGRDLEDFENTLDLLESYNIDGIDINAGCSSRRTLNSKSGAYLLKDLNHLEKLLNTVVKNTSHLVSLKTRIGDSNAQNIKKITSIINDSGIDFLTIHARTIKARFDKDKLNLKALKEFKQYSNIPVIGNGDITDPIFAKNMLDFTGVDGLMIGRETMGNPEIFRQISDFIILGNYKIFKNNIDIWYDRTCFYEKFLDDFLRGIELSISKKNYKFSELKRNSIWLTRNLPHSTNLRRNLSRARSLNQLKNKIEDIYSSN